MKLKDFIKYLNDQVADNPELLEKKISFRTSCFFYNPQGADTYSLKATPDRDDLVIGQREDEKNIEISLGYGTDCDDLG